MGVIEDRASGSGELLFAGFLKALVDARAPILAGFALALPRVTVPILRVIVLMRSQPQTGQRMPSGQRIDSR